MKQLLTAAMLCLVFASCKKDAAVQPAAPAEPRVKSTQINYGNGATYTSQYSYDAQGRISQIRYPDATETFTYEGSNKIITNHVPDNMPGGARRYEYFLNANGSAEKIVQTYPNGNIYSSVTIAYDADGLLRQMITEYPLQQRVYREEYINQNGVTVAVHRFENDVPSSHSEYTHDTAKPFKGFNQLYWNIISPVLFGKAQRHPYITAKLYDASGNLYSTSTSVASFLPSGVCTRYTITNETTNEITEFNFNY